ncbi:MAG TPA: hypothetical protein VKV02_11475 [Acidobacteriaceae bacterium]|nr:hypothetical protein [Acidobacteriaceae bacterium]
MSPRRPLNRYLDELISFGGEACTRAEAIAQMRSEGTPERLIDRWLQGQEVMARIQRRRAAITTRVFVARHDQDCEVGSGAS